MIPAESWTEVDDEGEPKFNADGNKNGMLDRDEHLGTLGDNEEAVATVQAAWAWIDAMSAEGRGEVLATYSAKDDAAGRDVLKFAVRFPAILVLAFGLIFLYFRSKGGYKPVELTGPEA